MTGLREGAGSATGSYMQLDEAPPALPTPPWKRWLDLGLVAVTTPFWLPLMLIIALGVKLSSKGPVIFRQERIGLNGKPFLCLKFRSMRLNADVVLHKQHLLKLMQANVPMVKLDVDKDPRLIPYGALLRATGLDELPQLFNVIWGEMSLVGPRPCTRYEYEQYQPWQKERFAVLPGLTGLWQVTGKNTTTFEQMVHLDIQYARTLSLRQDVQALLKTFRVVAAQVRGVLARKSQQGPDLAVSKQNMS